MFYVFFLFVENLINKLNCVKLYLHSQSLSAEYPVINLYTIYIYTM